MRADEVQVGMRVMYRPTPGGPPEYGTVVERREAGLVMVRYDGDANAKATLARDLEES